MKLEPLPGAPGYMVDTDNMVAYNYKTGIMRPVKTKTKYKKCGIICVNRYGAQMSTRGVASVLRDLGDKAGIAKEKMHPHAFRHFFAKMYLKKTKDVVGLADLLGHGSIDITRIYLQKSKEEQKRAYNRNITW